MNPHKILLIVSNAQVATCYGEALAKAGYHVSGALDGESGLQRFAQTQPEAAIIDLLLPGMSSSAVISAIRADSNLRDIPIFSLPTELESLVQTAHAAGLTTHLARSTNPVGAVVSALDTFFSISGPRSEQPRASAEATQRCAIEVSTRVASLRRSLQNGTNPTNPIPTFKELLHETHQFCEMAALLDRPSLFEMASAVENLVYDLDTMPQQATASTLRTVSQGIDFLDTLVSQDQWKKTKSHAPSTVLVVEDDDNARQLIAAAMQLVSLVATTAASPDEALKILAGQSFDLIFLDVGLPGMTGFELCTKIRGINAHHETPIVFLTGMATFQNRVQSSLSGGNDFIGKPFNLPELGVKALLWAFKGQLALATKAGL